MKNIFKQIKHAYTDNKEHLIRCTFAVVAASLILGLIIGLSVLVSAAEEPIESDQVIISAGTYRFNDVLTTPDTSIVDQNISLPFTFSSTVDGVTYSVVCDSLNLSIQYVYHAVSSTPSLPDVSYPFSAPVYFPEQYEDYYLWNVSAFGEGIKTITVLTNTNVDDAFFTWFESNTVSVESSVATIPAGTYFGVDAPSSGSFNVSFSFISDSYEFDTFYVGTDYITYRMLSGDVRSVNAFNFASDLWTINYETITVPTDQTLPADFVTWFNSNYTTQITPDPEPTYTISAGYYKARDSFTTSGWNVTNDSIRIRYYNDAANVQAYEVVDGISFISYYTDSGVLYASEIYYADLAVFTDSWNIDGAKNIQVLQDVTVTSDFYTVFNSVYAPSSEASNEFDSGYAAGYVDGRSDGYDIGYRQGYAQGLEDGDTNIFVDIIGGTLAAVDSFTIFGGFSLLDLISTLLGGMALVWILKLLAGG